MRGQPRCVGEPETVRQPPAEEGAMAPGSFEEFSQVSTERWDTVSPSSASGVVKGGVQTV